MIKESFSGESSLTMCIIRRWLLDLLVPGSFPDQFYRVGREVIKNKVDFLFFFLTHGNLSKQTVVREVKKIKGFSGLY